MPYYITFAGGSSISQWGNAKFADNALYTDKNIITAWDGKFYIEGQEPPEPVKTLDEVRAAKYAKVISKANAAKAAIRADFSDIEIDTWPTQEAGARAITGTEADVKNESATLILMSEAATARAVERVASLAAIDEVPPADFASRIIAHADQAYLLGNLTLDEQRGYEAAIKAIMAASEDEYQTDTARIKALEAIEVKYTVLEAANA